MVGLTKHFVLWLGKLVECGLEEVTRKMVHVFAIQKTTAPLTIPLFDVRATCCLGEYIEDGFSVTVSGGVKRTLLNFESGLRTDPHRGKNGGVKIHHRDRVLHSQ